MKKCKRSVTVHSVTGITMVYRFFEVTRLKSEAADIIPSDVKFSVSDPIYILTF